MKTLLLLAVLITGCSTAPATLHVKMAPAQPQTPEFLKMCWGDRKELCGYYGGQLYLKDIFGEHQLYYAMHQPNPDSEFVTVVPARDIEGR